MLSAEHRLTLYRDLTPVRITNGNEETMLLAVTFTYEDFVRNASPQALNVLICASYVSRFKIGSESTTYFEDRMKMLSQHPILPIIKSLTTTNANNMDPNYMLWSPFNSPISSDLSEDKCVAEQTSSSSLRGQCRTSEAVQRCSQKLALVTMSVTSGS